MNRSDRARQFLPFNALTGYYDLVRKVERKKEARKYLAEEELDKLSFIFNKLKKGMIVKVKYYLIDGYQDIEGMISKIDIVKRKITIVEEVIDFDDIIEVTSDEITINIE